MITKLHIENFKSLVDFDFPPGELRLGRFTCLIGLNGSGKTTLLQAFDFLGQLAVGKMAEWLEGREWKKNELISRLSKPSPVVEFRVAFRFDDSGEVVWQGRFNTNQLRCTFECISKAGATLLELNEGRITLAAAASDTPQVWERLDFDVSGSVMSFLKLTGAHPDVVRVKELLLGLKSFEMLSPHLLRRRSKGGTDIGIGGEKLAPFLARLSGSEQNQLHDRLLEFYPQLAKWYVKGYRAGWKGLLVWEKSSPYATRAAHLNDGLLRVVAILAQAYSGHRVLLFDEIENGINPELVGKLVDFLIHMDRQVIVTTHSPMILNYLPDEVAKEAVVLLYKLSNGRTRCVRFFDIPEMREKLLALGPGEVFVDTNLTELVGRLAAGENSQPALAAS